jgi:hypothetical protein
VKFARVSASRSALFRGPHESQLSRYRIDRAAPGSGPRVQDSGDFACDGYTRRILARPLGWHQFHEPIQRHQRRLQQRPDDCRIEQHVEPSPVAITFRSVPGPEANAGNAVNRIRRRSRHVSYRHHAVRYR